MVNSEDKSNPSESKVIILACLFLFFVGPLIFAWWYMESGQARALLRNNYGILLDPPVDIRAEEPLVELQKIDLRPGEWAAVYFTAGPCEESCAGNLKNLSIVRSLLGRDAPRLHIWSLVSTETVTSKEFQIINRDLASGLIEILKKQLPMVSFGSKVEGIVIIDWRSQLMMFYSDFEPAGIKKDLSRLLKASRLR